MKKIDLNIKADYFLLGEKEYKYKYKDEDRVYYIGEIIKLDFSKDNTEKLIIIFTKILEKQNLNTNISNNDVFGLFHYFNSVFL